MNHFIKHSYLRCVIWNLGHSSIPFSIYAILPKVFFHLLGLNIKGIGFLFIWCVHVHAWPAFFLPLYSARTPVSTCLLKLHIHGCVTKNVPQTNNAMHYVATYNDISLPEKGISFCGGIVPLSPSWKVPILSRYETSVCIVT